ncbi:MAG: sodium/proton antiporter NhaB [Gammaproteobacteria bacterium]|nr:sodium/proton antiporter NhaB [Gammaproteobacteria bacterium]MCP5199100.1 sodium/proton antiporter NhaB [Gammaproteobacteria bacterium]
MSARTLTQAFTANFLGHAPGWYKGSILGFLLLNALLVATVGKVAAGWALIGEFIFCLVMALKCYPLQPGGLLMIEAVLLGLTSAASVYEESLHNFPVIMLLMFMVAGIYFMQELLLFTFTRILLGVRSKALLSLLFCFAGAFLSAFLDALTVTAVVMSVAAGFYTVYHRVASGRGQHGDHDPTDDGHVGELHRSDLDEFRAFLRNLVMHAAVGTALGGVCTLVGEPQNLIVGAEAGWHFAEFFVRVAPVSMPVLALGLLTCGLLERTALFGYGAQLPAPVRDILAEHEARAADRDVRTTARLLVQGTAAVFLIFALAFHLAEVGIIGLTIIVLQTALNGVTEESRLGHAFEAAMPFTGLLVVFFGVVAVIGDQHLFRPLIDWVLALDAKQQASAFFLATGLLSSISDNVFVATIYITEVKNALDLGHITREHFDVLAVAINTGTNLPSVATPNGQAAFLFLLTSALAPLIRLSYGRMVWMALPYTVVLTLGGLACVLEFL